MVRYKSERIRWMDVPVKDPKVGDLRCEIRRPGPSRIPLDINLLQRLDDLLYRVLQRMYRRRVLLISTRSQRLGSQTISPIISIPEPGSRTIAILEMSRCLRSSAT
jgi:hypothetical protein